MISITGTGAAEIEFTLSYPRFTPVYGPPYRIVDGHEVGTWRCLVESSGTTSANVFASGNYWDGTPGQPTGAGMDLFRSPAGDQSYAIGSYESSFGTPVLDLDNGSGGGAYRADYALELTDEANGTTTFTAPGMSATAYNPAADQGGWWASQGSDEHLIIADTVHRYYYDFYHLQATDGAAAPASTSVGQIVAKDLAGTGNYGGNPIPGSGYPATINGQAAPGGTTASKITGYAGTILPHELDCATCINHALAVIVPSNMNGCNGSENGSGAGLCNGYVQFANPFNGQIESCNEGPQTGGDAQNKGGEGSDIIFCEGAKIFLPSSFTLQPATPGAQIPVAAQAIVYALQQYGGIIVDQGTSPTVLRFYTAGYYDITDPATPMPPASLQYEGIDPNSLAPYMQQIGANLRIAYSCPFDHGQVRYPNPCTAQP
ncbi:MAG: hypothetical protein ACRD13_00955 [Terriglobales bacterium]